MHHHIPSEISARYLPRDKTMNGIAAGLFIVGLISFVIRLGQDSLSAWISYVSNWMFFSSIAMGSVMFAIATWIVKAKWNWSLRRVSQAGAAFLPIAFVMLRRWRGIQNRHAARVGVRAPASGASPVTRRSAPCRSTRRRSRHGSAVSPAPTSVARCSKRPAST